jgi:hypothetical protein
MNHRRSLAVVGFAGVLALAACGTDDQITQPAARPASASQDAAAAFQHYYDVTHPEPKTAIFNGDAKDHPRYGGQVESPAFNGDAKDHPRYSHVAIPVAYGDAKDHPGYGQIEPAGSQVLALRVSPSLQDQRASMQVELAALAERDGLTGLSPAFLQRAQVCSGLSPAFTSGCTTDELRAALPGNPR